MIRTQIYLTERQRAKLAMLSKSSGKKQSELIREAIDSLIDLAGQDLRESVSREAYTPPSRRSQYALVRP